MLDVGDTVRVTGYPVSFPWMEGLVGEEAEVLELSSGLRRIDPKNFPSVWISRNFLEAVEVPEATLEEVKEEASVRG